MHPNTPEKCNCLALRQASRLVSQLYDQGLAASGLRTTQFSILAKLERLGPMSINALAAALVVDRTTLGRNILPLQRDGLIAVTRGAHDARSRELKLTRRGAARLAEARPAWQEAQKRFEAAYGAAQAVELRTLLHAVVAGELGAAPLSDE